MSRKAPTPIRSTPSSAPLEAMVAKQQSHIDELVMKNRSLEQTVTKVRAELSAEKARWEGIALQMKQQSKAELAEWKKGCDALQSSWRIQQLRAVVDLEKERISCLKLKEELRQEQLARLHRDFQIGMFQAKESELEDRIQQLTIELDGKDEEKDESVKLAEELEVQLRASEEQLEQSAQARKRLEKTLSELRAEHTSLVASSTTSTAAVERANLQVEGLKSSLAELQEKYDASQKKNSDLLRQLEKWRNMESRDGDELETIRKRKVELEVQIKRYEERLVEATATEKERDKLKVKIEKYKVSLTEHQSALDDANKELEELEAEMGSVMGKLTEAEGEIQRLTQQLTQADARPPSSPKQRKRTVSNNVSADRNIHEASRSPSPPVEQAPKPKPKPKPKAATKKKAADVEDDSDVQMVEPVSHSQSAGETYNFDFGDIEDDEIEEVDPPPPKKDKGKGKATTSSDAAPAKKPRGQPKKVQKSPSPPPDDIQVVESRDPGGKKKGKRKAGGSDEDGDEPVKAAPKKRKKVVSDGDDDDPVKAAPKSRKKKVVEDEGSSEDISTKRVAKDTAKPTNKGKGKAGASSAGQNADSDTAEASAVPKKKKRKINIFSSSDAPPSFDLGFKGLTQGDGGLNIPLELSPVKDSRSGTSTLGRALSGLSGSAGRR